MMQLRGEVSDQNTGDLLFEISWEVANKCGGIYTVITSKASYVSSFYDLYYAVGPLLSIDEFPHDFIPQTPPASFSTIFSILAKQGIRCEFGLWDIPGRPKTILIAPGEKLLAKKNDIKKFLWDDFGVDSLFSEFSFEEPVLWSYAVGLFLEEVQKYFSKKSIVAHAHEWLSGAAILYLQKQKSLVATVFTTHATMLGRSLSSRGVSPDDLPSFDQAEISARDLGIIDKFTMERACAVSADAFSTVSSITANECERFFSRKPVIVPNGIPAQNMPTFEEASYNHVLAKRSLKKFILGYFFPYYTFDLSETLFFYTSGRYEFNNKGMDLALEALAKLDATLQAQASKKTVVMFFFVATDGCSRPRHDVLENINNVLSLYSAVEEQREVLQEQVILDIFSQANHFFPSKKSSFSQSFSKPFDEVFSPTFVKSLQRRFRASKKQGSPPLSTHDCSSHPDPVLSACHRLGLTNSSKNKVKIVFVPAYLDGRDGVLDMTYINAIRACNLGIFPSVYEPWGYTPLESMAEAIPAITTSQSGFGRFMSPLLPSSNQGLFVLDYSFSKKELVSRLYSVLLSFSSFSKKERVASKINAQELALKADWNTFIVDYVSLYASALANVSRSDKPFIRGGVDE
jgi:glycogen synthase